ncbi:hypothetical protein DFH29DRAFT_875035 [Suillus ampliporus]|nr:hypothetical protein DFH29DRAFT_875035 [Suillus ampliporus]
MSMLGYFRDALPRVSRSERSSDSAMTEILALFKSNARAVRDVDVLLSVAVSYDVLEHKLECYAYFPDKCLDQVLSHIRSLHTSKHLAYKHLLKRAHAGSVSQIYHLQAPFTQPRAQSQVSLNQVDRRDGKRLRLLGATNHSMTMRNGYAAIPNEAERKKGQERRPSIYVQQRAENTEGLNEFSETFDPTGYDFLKILTEGAAINTLRQQQPVARPVQTPSALGSDSASQLASLSYTRLFPPVRLLWNHLIELFLPPKHHRRPRSHDLPLTTRHSSTIFRTLARK